MAERKKAKPINIRDIHIKFASEEHCLAYVESMRWPDGVVRCPTCGNDKVKKIRRETESKNKRPWFYLCLEKSCHQQFSPTAGTLFADSHLPLITWFHAIGLVLNAKKGISAAQLQRDLGLGGYKTAWYLLHRIRESMMDVSPRALGGIVEIDETYVGGKQKGKGVYYGKKQKQTVMGAVERTGEIRLRHVPNTKNDTVKGFISANVSDDAERIHTDQSAIYPAALVGHTATHETVNHIIREYARGDVTTNRIESAFSLFKRGLIGQYHKLSAKHLHRYLTEFEYRFNRRYDDDAFIQTVRRLCRVEPLRFADLIGNPKGEPF